MRRGALSMARRVALLFTVASSLVLAGVTTILYREVADHLTEEHAHLVSGFVRMVGQQPSHWLAGGGDERHLHEVVAGSGHLGPFLVRRVAADGRILDETAGMEQVPPAAFEGVGVSEPGGVEVPPVLRPGRDGGEFLLAQVRLPAGASTVRVQVALDNEKDAELLAGVRRTSWVLLLLGIAVSAVAAAVVTRVGLRPVRQLTDEVARVTAADLEGGLAAGDWPKELVALAAALDEMLHRLDAAFSGLSRFAANLAHEVRTPLNNLRGEAEVALSRGRSVEEYRAVLESSLEEYERLTSMIEALLFLARAEGRDERPEREPIDLGEKARAVSELYQPLAEEREVSLVVRGEATMEGSPTLVRRALANLLDNALRFTPPGGTVSVEVAPREGGGARVTVSDTGPGIAPDELPHVLERFYRGRGNTRSGSGLGLAIVESIVRLHRGRVTVESEPGQGASVTLSFPGR